MKKTLLSIILPALASMAAFAIKAEPKGELIAIYSEYFEALTNGSTESPAPDELSIGGKIDTSLTGGMQWQGRGVHEAGGALAVMTYEQTDWFGTEEIQGYIHTPYYDVRMDDGNLTVRFKARSYGSEMSKLIVELYDPYVTNNIDYAEVEITDRWTTYEIDMCHPGFGNHLAFIEIAAIDGDWLLDDFEIVQDYFELLPPVVHYPRNVTYEHFTGRWNEMPLTDSYQVSVFSLDEAGNRVDLKKDIPTEECSLTVEGTVKGTDYYYTVRSVNDRYTSEESEPTRVYVSLSELDKPVTLEAESVSTDGFVARWQLTFRAMGYVIGLKKQYVATEDGEATIVSEDFEKITDGTLDWPAPFYGNLDDFTTMPGWNYNYFTVRVAAGMFGLENYYKKYGEEVFLSSPSLDLTGDNGRFTVTMDVYGDKGDVVSVTCDDKILTHTLDEQGQQSFSLEFDNGSATTAIRIEFDGDGPSKLLFIDAIAITQDYHPGDTVKENVGNYRTQTTDTAYEFSGLNASEGDVYSYTVTAWAYSLDEDGVYGPDIFSEVSEPCNVVIIDAAGLTDLSGSAASVKVCGKQLLISSDEMTRAEVFNLNGVKLADYRISDGLNVFSPDYCGVVIVRIGTKVFRVII